MIENEINLVIIQKTENNKWRKIINNKKLLLLRKKLSNKLINTRIKIE